MQKNNINKNSML